MRVLSHLVLLLMFINEPVYAQEKYAANPLIFADVPDMSMVRVGDMYYMSSTTMHMSPGVPIMRSRDLVNWEIVNYAYDVLDDVEELNLENGKSAYGAGSWASCIRYYNNTFHVSTFSGTTGTTYIYTTSDIINGPWKVTKFKPSYHDHSIFFDDDGKKYMIWGSGKLSMIELKEDLSGVRVGTEMVLIENAGAPAGYDIGLPAEGSQLFKVNGKYYLFNIAWPGEGMRTVIVHRADKITGPYEGKVALTDRGIAQGGLIDTPEGNWFCYLFRDYGSVGRIPYLAPVTWEDGWPVIGLDGKVPEKLDLPPGRGLMPGIVASDDFIRKKRQPALPPVWQWNHNPDNNLWSVSNKKGHLQLITGRIDSTFLLARNTLTQRVIGPECFSSTMVDISHMKDGDIAGLALLQQKYGLAGVKFEDGEKFIVMIHADSEEVVEEERIPLRQNFVYFKATCNFTDLKDETRFYYSLDGRSWKNIGSVLKMQYTLPHFMGYRFGLFNYATRNPGGYVLFDYFHVSDQIE